MKKDVITLEKITYKNYIKVLFGLNGIATVCGPPIGGKPNSYGMPRKMNLPKSNIRFRVSRAYFMRPNVGNDREMTIGGKL